MGGVGEETGILTHASKDVGMRRPSGLTPLELAVNTKGLSVLHNWRQTEEGLVNYF